MSAAPTGAAAMIGWRSTSALSLSAARREGNVGLWFASTSA